MATETENLEENKLAIERHFTAGPPEGLQLVEPGETFATVKEEEWISKKTTEVTNTKQIETRVKRQVVLEDGRLVEDSGPMVTTNTTEDTETQKYHQTELRKEGDDDDKGKKAALENGEKKTEIVKDAVAVPNPDGLVREVKERRVISREEIDDVKETEDVQHLGDITDEAFLAAVNSGKTDLRKVLKTKEAGHALVSTGPRIINESHRSNKVTDTEETKELSSVLPDGRIVTEIERKTEHEEVKDDELPEGVPDQNHHRENHERLYKVRDQEDVDYVADGVKVGHEMRFKAETTEVERRGDGVDEPDWDSLSARVKRRQQNGGVRQVQRIKGIEGGLIPSASPLDRKDALTRKPLDFDQEEETRKLETSKWLEHHFGSESRSSRDSLDDIDEEKEEPVEPRTSFFNVTIKSQPTVQSEYVSKVQQHVEESPAPPVHENGYHHRQTRYFQGVSEWSEREQRKSPIVIRGSSPTYVVEERYQITPPRDYRNSPSREVTPTPPQRKRMQDRPQRLAIRPEDDGWVHNGSKTPSRNEILDEPLEEPPPDYSPVSPPRAVTPNKKVHQKTRFAVDLPPAKVKSGNIIGQSIRKLVGKIRSASAERKARQQQQRTKRSPSPSYKQGHVIDNIHESQNGHHHMENGRRENSPGPVHRYYLGEDPFGGSIYGRENKYDGVRPARSTRKQYIQQPEEYRSHSTLGRFSKSTSRLGYSSAPDNRSSQTLPRHLSRHEPPTRLEKNDRSNSTINVSFINTVSSPNKPLSNGAPAKPARTYKSNLSRSKSFNVDLESPYRASHKMQLPSPSGLKSPGLISSISRSQRDLTEDGIEYKSTSRFVKNGVSDNKRMFLNDLKQRAPELYKTLHDEEKNESWRYNGTPPRHYNGDIYEPPTRLRDTHVPKNFKESFAPSLTPTTRAIIRRGSNSSNDYSETYHTSTRNDDPQRPTITNTVQSFSKKTVPTRNGNSFQTIESTETKSITKSRYRDPGVKQVYTYDRRLNNSSGPVVIEVRNNYK
ncbi:hypothetical protein RI129_009418 [Pyrocoelia pectoralis]|uniref:Uncharacterized protein n=1 Tax=Pyrocoelia pectoralis TaxID=417401 RepID=A0AAN7V8F7_9COLE